MSFRPAFHDATVLLLFALGVAGYSCILSWVWIEFLLGDGITVLWPGVIAAIVVTGATAWAAKYRTWIPRGLGSFLARTVIGAGLVYLIGCVVAFAVGLAFVRSLNGEGGVLVFLSALWVPLWGTPAGVIFASQSKLGGAQRQTLERRLPKR